MNSVTLPSFWDLYCRLDRNIRVQAKKAYYLWSEDPFHPSLRFKCINRKESIWALRISIGYRAVGILEDNAITWFWVGNHDDYEKFFG
ncbi:MAG: hypothetical protein HQM10_00240 [Candidatus Riflebacteria bacterium]|nr:hypothetical protein [Candidatus Riflebacteria bacterium]